MSIARKILDLHGQDTTDLAKELQALPHGRYKLVPENEFAADLTPEEEDGVIAAMDEVERGEWVSGEQMISELNAMLKSAQ